MKKTSPKRIWDGWTAGILFAVAAFMFWAAGYYTVFDDEAFSLQRYVLPPGEMVSALWNGIEPDPPLYYILQNLSLRIFGTGPVGIRGLSMVMFLVGLLVIRAAAQAWFDARAARWAMLISAIHPAHIFFGFAARWYSTMFLAVAILLWATARVISRTSWRTVIVWSIAAAAVLYTNYFGVVVVFLLAIIALSRSTRRLEPSLALLGALALYTPWLPAFWRNATSFPELGGGWKPIAATAARTLMALLAGNLASPRAWWAWFPLGVFSVGLLVLFFRSWRAVVPLAFVVIGCFLAGMASRTMIDKYVMTFSGPVCVLVAALLTAKSNAGHVRQITVQALVIGWLICGVNLVTERNWSSLRWLDPFPTAIAEAIKEHADIPVSSYVVTHPSARYYLARAGVDAASIPTPDAIAAEITSSPYRLPTLLVIQSADFAESFRWLPSEREIASRYSLIAERKYLHDPEAEWKDWIDPKYAHPRWRIAVRRWTLKNQDEALFPN